MNKEQTAETVKSIAQALGDGWRYNEVYTKEFLRYSHMLSNGAGLYIEVFSTYGKNLTQFSLSYRDPKYKHFPKVMTIGCSLKKSTGAIVSDLKSRLLSKTHEAYQALATKTKEYQKAGDQKDMKRLQFQAFQRVACVIDPDGYESKFLVMNHEDERLRDAIGRLDYIDASDTWNLDLYGLPAETVIKILALVKAERER